MVVVILDFWNFMTSRENQGFMTKTAEKPYPLGPHIPI